MFGAGSTTTASAISVVIMAAACFPETQTWVQEELDTVVGHKRGVFFPSRRRESIRIDELYSSTNV